MSSALVYSCILVYKYSQCIGHLGHYCIVVSWLIQQAVHVDLYLTLVSCKTTTLLFTACCTEMARLLTDLQKIQLEKYVQVQV